MMVEVKVYTTKKAIVRVSPEQIVEAFCPESGLEFWEFTGSAGKGYYELTFGTRDEATRLVGKETHFVR